jgi:hypothetical protein
MHATNKMHGKSLCWDNGSERSELYANLLHAHWHSTVNFFLTTTATNGAYRPVIVLTVERGTGAGAS